MTGKKSRMSRIFLKEGFLPFVVDYTLRNLILVRANLRCCSWTSPIYGARPPRPRLHLGCRKFGCRLQDSHIPRFWCCQWWRSSKKLSWLGTGLRKSYNESPRTVHNSNAGKNLCKSSKNFWHFEIVHSNQIDTFNRDKMNLTGTPFVPGMLIFWYPHGTVLLLYTLTLLGPYPRNNLAPKSGPDAVYSGLLECPLTTRITKMISGQYKALNTGSCKDPDRAPISTAEECFGAATKIGINPSVKIVHSQGSDPTLPPACSATLSSDSKTVRLNDSKSVHVFQVMIFW